MYLNNIRSIELVKSFLMIGVGAPLMQLIEKKVKAGGKQITAHKGRAPLPTNVVDTIKVLKKSLAETSKKKSAGSPSTARKRKRA
jgi:non-homologous end joining protein Ku